MALTYPGGLIATGGIKGALLDEANRWNVTVPLVTMFVTGLVNWVYCLPVTNSITAKRRAQGMLIRLVSDKLQESRLTRPGNRKERRQAELGSRAALAGDAVSEQAVWKDSRHLFSAQPGHIDCNHHIWFQPVFQNHLSLPLYNCSLLGHRTRDADCRL